MSFEELLHRQNIKRKPASGGASAPAGSAGSNGVAVPGASTGILAPQQENRFRAEFEDQADPAYDLTVLGLQLIVLHFEMQNYKMMGIFEMPAIDGNTFVGDLMRWYDVTVTGLDVNDNPTYKMVVENCQLKEHVFGQNYASSDSVLHHCTWDFTSFQFLTI